MSFQEYSSGTHGAVSADVMTLKAEFPRAPRCYPVAGYKKVTIFLFPIVFCRPPKCNALSGDKAFKSFSEVAAGLIAVGEPVLNVTSIKKLGNKYVHFLSLLTVSALSPRCYTQSTSLIFQ